MLKVKNGDMRAFEELVHRNTSRVHSLVFRFLGEPTMADDLTQEVFMRIYRNAHRYEPAAKFSTWLYRIVANLSFNVLRDRRKSRSISLESISNDESWFRDIPDASANEPHRRFDTEELGEKLARAIASLPDNQRIGFVLSRYEHKRYKEIAEILDCSTKAVKSLLSRARMNLRQALSKYLD